VKLATLRAAGSSTVAAVVGDEGAIRVDGYADVGELLRAERGLPDAAAASEGNAPSRYEPGDLLTVIPSPGAVFCVGLNYRAHILEMGRELPANPTLFAKLTRTLAAPYAEIPLSGASGAFDYEGELVVVVGRGGRDIPLDQAEAHIAGYTVMNDVSARDWQNRTLQWFAGKNFAGSTPVGPWVVTRDEVDLADAKLVTSVNGEVRQQADIADLVFGPAALVADISRMTRLEPGDLIATGTPGGVGHAMDPPRHLAAGDVVEVAIGSVGTIRNRFVGP
jgi:acylpyruvate hydrolase